MPSTQRRLAALLIMLNLLASSGFTVAQDSTATFTPTSTVTATQFPTLNLQLFISRGSLTLYTPETVSLAGLTLVAVEQRPFIYIEAFDGLSLTGGIAAAESCFVLRDPAGADDPLAGACREAATAGRVFLLNISAADNFWFDPITNQLSALAIQRRDSLLLTASGVPAICPGGQPACEFEWPVEIFPIPTSTPTSVVSTPIPVKPCPNSAPTRLKIGIHGRVFTSIAINLRDTPVGDVVGQMRPGGNFVVLEGPICGIDNMTFWLVQYDDIVGWTAEGEADDYWLEPLFLSDVGQPCPNSPPTRLAVGMQGIVSDGEPNSLRDVPSGTIFGQIPSGGEFTVISGPECGRTGLTFWLVEYSSNVGWTAEGYGNTYWLEPLERGRGCGQQSEQRETGGYTAQTPNPPLQLAPVGILFLAARRVGATRRAWRC
ncbi:MAG: hypothetical protein J0M33_10040 [Anaerolineae bacterium]|nr:hypothetical protein [Anaerolineae bacterium]